GQQRMGQRGTAVVGQRAEFRVDGVGRRAHLVAVDVGEAGGAGAVADQVVAAAAEAAGDVGAGPVQIDEVLGDDAVPHVGGGAEQVEDAAAGVGAVVGDGDVAQGQGDGVDAAALLGGVAADGAVRQRRRAGVDAAAVGLVGEVVADGA